MPATESRTSIAPTAQERAASTFVFVLFFLSGFAALLYQVVWQRMLAIFSGVDVYSVTIIVAAFMAGLGVGSLVGGYVADRLSGVKRLLCFAGCELAIALFALISKWLYYDVLYSGHHGIGRSAGTLAVVLFLSLLWPTFFMGMSLPLLSKSLTRSIRAAAGTVGALYGWNTLGAAVGAFAAAWIVTRTFGFETTIRIGAAINALCGVGVLLVTPLLTGGGEPSDDEAPSEAPPAQPLRLSFSTWIAIYALSGFIALSLEILWFRILAVLTKPSAFTFSNLLALYLIGLAGGTLVGIPFARRAAHPGRWFFFLQAGVPVYAGISLAALIAGLGRFAPLDELWAYLGGYDSMDMRAALEASTAGARSRLIQLYFVLPSLLIVPATWMMGMSFPLLQQVVQTDARVLGRRVGWLQTANIAGAMLGTVLTGWLSLGWLGTPGALRLLILLGAVFLFLGCRSWAAGRGGIARISAYAVALLVCLGCILAVPGGDRMWSRLHGTDTAGFLHLEDATGLAVVKEEPDDPERDAVIFVNGLGQSWIPFGDLHTMLGALPTLLHPEPTEVAVIGLGSGATLFGAGGRSETRRITCYELIGPQLSTLKTFQNSKPYGGLASILEDPRIRYEVADGRVAVMREKTRYDVIEADAVRPNSAYSGNLYSVEYFTLLRSRLNKGGLAVTWSPTRRVEETFTKVFPYTLLVDPILVGSNEPIESDYAALLNRAAEPSTRAYFQRAGIDILALIRGLRSSSPLRTNPETDRSMLVDLNTDLFPKDEFLVP